MGAPGYEEFLRKRGFDPKDSSHFIRRAFITCWGEPGFHRFWRLWNPFYGYGLLRLYLALGGQRRPLVASFVVFVACGFLLHDLPAMLLMRQLSFNSTIAFGVFWAFASVSRRLSPRLRQEHWPRAANAACNALLIVGGLAMGSVVQRLLGR
jgi:hypothetical protein